MQRMDRVARLLAPALVAIPLALGACGGSDAGVVVAGTRAPESTEAPGNGLCDAFQTIADLDDATQTLSTTITEAILGAGEDGRLTDEARAELAKLAPDIDRLDRAYKDLARLLDGEDAQAARDVGRISVQMLRRVEKAKTVADLEAAADPGDELGDVVGGTLALDTISQRECGIVLAD
jgi:hypothetical protein